MLARIFLVDDHADTVNAIRIFLSRAGYTVILASNIRTALQDKADDQGKNAIKRTMACHPDGSYYVLHREQQ